jgi:hypothetical protein
MKPIPGIISSLIVLVPDTTFLPLHDLHKFCTNITKVKAGRIWYFLQHLEANHVPRSKDQNLSKILIYNTEERKNIP